MTETAKEMLKLANELKRLCCAETEGKFFDCVTDNIDTIIEALRQAAAPQGREALEDWIKENFTGQGRAVRLQSDAPIPDEPFMSMEDAKELTREAVAKFAPADGAGLKSVENEIARKIYQLDEYIVQHCQGDAPEKVYERTIAEGRKLQANMDLILVSRAAQERRGQP